MIYHLFLLELKQVLVVVPWLIRHKHGHPSSCRLKGSLILRILTKKKDRRRCSDTHTPSWLSPRWRFLITFTWTVAQSNQSSSRPIYILIEYFLALVKARSCCAHSWHWKADKKISISNFNDVLVLMIAPCFGANYLFLLFWLWSSICCVCFYVPRPTSLPPIPCNKLVSLIKRARGSLAAMAMGWHDVPVSVPAGDARTEFQGSRCWQGRHGTVPSGPALRPHCSLALCRRGWANAIHQQPWLKEIKTALRLLGDLWT